MQRRPRVLFVGRSAAHFSYYETVLAALLERGAEVELALDRGWSGKLETPIAHAPIAKFVELHPELKVGWLTRRADAWRNPIFALRELRAYRSYLARRETTDFYVRRWERYLPSKLAAFKQQPLKALLRTGLGEGALQLAEAATPCDSGIVAFIAARRPDVLIVSPMNARFSEETDYVKAARKLSVPTALLVLTWDNLSTKGLIQIMPDRVLAWNEQHRDDAVAIHGVPPERISIVGAPFFDKWFDRSAEIEWRESFCARAGLDPSAPFLLYLGSSRNIAEDETWFVREMQAALSARARPVQLLVRPHPANAGIYASMPDVRVWPKAGALPETAAALADMRAAFAHCVGAVGVNTSAMIDAVLADIPTFSVLLPRYAETQSEAVHFRHLRAAGALEIVPDMAAFMTAIECLSAGQDERAQGRARFAENFARPHGLNKSAGVLAAEEALKLAQ